MNNDIFKSVIANLSCSINSHLLVSVKCLEQNEYADNITESAICDVIHVSEPHLLLNVTYS